MAQDPFDELGVEAAFDVDLDDVRRQWLRRSLDAHPDRAGSDDAARALAARLNHAKRVLEDDESRADALLVKLGGPARDEEKGLPGGFLMEIMGLREGLEAAQAAGDPAALAAQREVALRERAARVERVRAMFAEASDEAGLRAIRVELNAWRYIERMLEQIELTTGAP